MLRIEIDTGNAAFEDSPWSECARILRQLADDMERNGGVPFNLRDINGNRVGKAEVVS